MTVCTNCDTQNCECVEIDQTNYGNAGGCDHTNFHYWWRCVCGGGRTWYSTIEPSTHRPPGGPWVPAGVGGVPYPSGVGDTIWVARQNFYVETNEKSWTITITGPNADKYGVNSVKGYKADEGPGQPATEVPVAAATGVKDDPGPPKTRTFTFKFRPQPDWEVARIVRTVAGVGLLDETMETTSSSVCTRITTTANQCALAQTRFGVQNLDVSRIVEVTMFPDEVSVDPAGPHTFNAPPGSGTWTPQIVFVDPDGHPRPQGGVRWITSGFGLTPGDVCSLRLFMAGPADAGYSLYALDANEPAQQYFRLVPDVQPIPTVSEWGLIVLGLLLLAAGTVVLRRRRAVQPTA